MPDRQRNKIDNLIKDFVVKSGTQKEYDKLKNLVQETIFYLEFPDERYNKKLFGIVSNKGSLSAVRRFIKEKMLNSSAREKAEEIQNIEEIIQESQQEAGKTHAGRKGLLHIPIDKGVNVSIQTVGDDNKGHVISEAHVMNLIFERLTNLELEDLKRLLVENPFSIESGTEKIFLGAKNIYAFVYEGRDIRTRKRRKTILLNPSLQNDQDKAYYVFTILLFNLLREQLSAKQASQIARVIILEDINDAEEVKERIKNIMSQEENVEKSKESGKSDFNKEGQWTVRDAVIQSIGTILVLIGLKIGIAVTVFGIATAIIIWLIFKSRLKDGAVKLFVAITCAGCVSTSPSSKPSTRMERRQLVVQRIAVHPGYAHGYQRIQSNSRLYLPGTKIDIYAGYEKEGYVFIGNNFGALKFKLVAGRFNRDPRSGALWIDTNGADLSNVRVLKIRFRNDDGLPVDGGKAYVSLNQKRGYNRAEVVGPYIIQNNVIYIQNPSDKNPVQILFNKLDSTQQNKGQPLYNLGSLLFIMALFPGIVPILLAVGAVALVASGVFTKVKRHNALIYGERLKIYAHLSSLGHEPASIQNCLCERLKETGRMDDLLRLKLALLDVVEQSPEKIDEILRIIPRSGNEPARLLIRVDFAREVLGKGFEDVLVHLNPDGDIDHVLTEKDLKEARFDLVRSLRSGKIVSLQDDRLNSTRWLGMSWRKYEDFDPKAFKKDIRRAKLLTAEQEVVYGHAIQAAKFNLYKSILVLSGINEVFTRDIQKIFSGTLSSGFKGSEKEKENKVSAEIENVKKFIQQLKQTKTHQEWEKLLEENNYSRITNKAVERYLSG
ncbi:MAG: hypothetical protein KC618_05080, partial [Candidatus Omnitrophica bacterium]|nr:hypothetical protein [Candidatus Omnitrophota bacterium]